MIVSTTLANAQTDPALVACAVRSGLTIADKAILLDTSTDGQIELFPEESVEVIRIGWRDDFSWARNRALDEAEKRGATWALHVDTDEVLHVEPEVVRPILATTTHPVVLLADVSGTYSKARLVRLPVADRYVGRTHEAIAGWGPTLPGHFSEEPKNAAQLAFKAERDIRILREELKADPGNSRWLFYLARTLADAGRKKEALPIYESCITAAKWDEEKAWSARNCAEICLDLQDFEQAVRYAELGLRYRADFRELWASLARAHQWLDHQVQALRFAKMGLSVPHEERTIFRDPFWAGPGLYRIVAHSLTRLGDTQGASIARLGETGVPGWSDDIVPFYSRVGPMIPKGGIAVEVGVAWGRSLLHLARVVDPSVTLYGVDTWPSGWNDGAEDWFAEAARTVAIDRFHLLRINGARAARLFDDASVGLVFLDTDHDEATLRGEIEAWLPKVCGILAGHDYDENHPGVRAAVDRLVPGARVEGTCWSIELSTKP